jgi:hypothetical protein
MKRTNKFPVGKEIGGCVYAHRLYERQFPDIRRAKAKLPKGFKYDVVKYNVKTKMFSFMISEDFDTNPEPSVNGGISVGFKLKTFKDAGWIYHHKWMFVADDYKGFDVEASKKRSQKWTRLKGIDKSRIGQRKFWDALDIDSQI